MTLTKAELSQQICNEIGLSLRESKQLVDGFFNEIKGNLEQAEPVKLSGFGVFNLRDKKERPGRNPKTGLGAVISARRVVTFRMGQKLKTSVVSATTGEWQNQDYRNIFRKLETYSLIDFKVCSGVITDLQSHEKAWKLKWDFRPGAVIQQDRQ